MNARSPAFVHIAVIKIVVVEILGHHVFSAVIHFLFEVFNIFFKALSFYMTFGITGTAKGKVKTIQ
jgi:hypothetical protein